MFNKIFDRLKYPGIRIGGSTPHPKLFAWAAGNAFLVGCRFGEFLFEFTLKQYAIKPLEKISVLIWYNGSIRFWFAPYFGRFI